MYSVTYIDVNYCTYILVDVVCIPFLKENSDDFLVLLLVSIVES